MKLRILLIETTTDVSKKEDNYVSKRDCLRSEKTTQGKITFPTFLRRQPII